MIAMFQQSSFRDRMTIGAVPVFERKVLVRWLLRRGRGLGRTWINLRSRQHLLSMYHNSYAQRQYQIQLIVGNQSETHFNRALQGLVSGLSK